MDTTVGGGVQRNVASIFAVFVVKVGWWVGWVAK